MESLLPVLDFQLLRTNLRVSSSSAGGIKILLISRSGVDLAELNAKGLSMLRRLGGTSYLHSEGIEVVIGAR